MAVEYRHSYTGRLIGNHTCPIEWHNCSDLGHICRFNLCNTHNSGNLALFSCSMFTYKLEGAKGLQFKLFVKGEGLLKFTSIHVHWKSGKCLGNGAT